VEPSRWVMPLVNIARKVLQASMFMCLQTAF
jgi:hypothetical protein